MKTRKLKRALTLALLLSSISFGVWIVMSTLNKNIMFFYTPTEFMQLSKPPANIKLGGIVKPGSIKKTFQHDVYLVQFTLTDCKNDILVRYNGVLPSLFREKQGIVAIGDTHKDGTFHAKTLLAKHDENYVPKGMEYTLPKESICNPINYKK